MIPDVAQWRIPQQMRALSGGLWFQIRQCPLRPDRMLLDHEGPHAKSWLAVRGDTVKLRQA